ncbi:hypothetical protein K501DRAFT_321374 [Backusella circina FSU 941]|nr:hypothetical protein K501DRAFT_321374 [Backusella circina FSU 941]
MLPSNEPVWKDNKQSLADLTVGEILELYKSDTELLKHVLNAKAEEDKRRTAEEIRKAEEARLQAKFIDLQLGQGDRRSSLLDDTASLGLSSHDWLSPSLTNDMIPAFNNTPPSPTASLLQPLSPYTLFDVPFSELKLSAPSSPEPNQSDDKKAPAELTPPTVQKTERASCKRTLSRSRSHRKPSTHRTSAAKKNRSQPVENPTAEDKRDTVTTTTTTTTETPPPTPALNHDKVMEALRAKLKRSSQQPKDQTPKQEEYTSMSPSGILLLDLKNPKKTFPVRPTPRASVVRKPNSFISAHKVKEPSL